MKAKLLFSLIISFIINFNSMAQQAQYSNFSKRCIDELRLKETLSQGKAENSLVVSQEIQEKYALAKTAKGYEVGAVITVNLQKIKEKDLQDLNIAVNSKIGDIWTLQLPIYSLPKIGTIEGIIYVEINVPQKKNLDAARTETLVTTVHAGTGLSKAYSGRGIVVGVIDGGFDYTHPTFNNAQGNSFRISRVWEQKNSNGLPPTGFSGGRELVGFSAINNARHDAKADGTADGSHGTHVASIAAGSGSIISAYRGVAYDAEIVLVSGNSDLENAVKYIFDYANSVNKPCVVNMSLGRTLGPHDGTTQRERAYSNLIGNGKIIVASAGNEGSDKLHFSYDFRNTSNVYRASLLNFSPNEPINKQRGKGLIDVWGSANSSFQLNVFVVNAQGQLISGAQTGFFSTTDQDQNKTLSTPQGSVKVSATIQSSNTFNNRPNITLDIDNPTENFVGVLVTSTNSDVHMWNDNEGDFVRTPTPSLSISNNPVVFQEGNTDYTISGTGANSNAVISVGSYITKNSWRSSTGQTINRGGTIGAISDFSSRGPTLDGRTKPDITAPGQWIVAAVNSFDTNYGPNNSDVVSIITNSATNQSRSFGALQGTSMASPLVAGIVGLLLEANPTLNTQQVRTILQNQGRRLDSFTGSIASTGSNTWGWGKINALESMRQAELLPKFAAQISTTDAVTFCDGQTATLRANTGTGFSYQWQRNNVNIAGATLATLQVTQTGIYTVAITQNSTTLTSNSINITANPTPTRPTVMLNKNSFCQGEVVVFTANSTGATEYNWSISGLPPVQTTTNSYTFRTNTNTRTGNFTITVSSKNGNCVSQNSESMSWTVNQTPTTPTFRTTLIPNDANPTLVSSSNAGNQWYLNGNVIAGATGQTHRVVESGNYGLRVTIGTCSADAVQSIITGLEEEIINNTIKVYPNPTDKKLFLEFQNTLTDETNVVIYSVEGKVIHSEKATNQSKLEFNLDNFSKGLYLLTISTNKSFTVRKFIKN